MPRLSPLRRSSVYRSGRSSGNHLVGYPKKIDGKWALTDWHGKVISEKGHQIGCTPIRPGAPGHWIDTKRCTYRFKVHGKWYSMRGYGEGVVATGRKMARSPRTTWRR